MPNIPRESLMTADEPSKSPVTIVISEPGEDVELKAIAWLSSILRGLTPDIRRRALNYLCERFPEKRIELGKE